MLDPTLLTAPDAGEKRVAFLLGGLRALDADLRGRGSRLIVRQGDPAEELARLAESETGAAGVFAEADPWPYARQRDARVAGCVPLTLTEGITARPYDAITKAGGGAYTVFTPFSRAWKALPLPRPTDLLPAPERLAAPPEIAQPAHPRAGRMGRRPCIRPASRRRCGGCTSSRRSRMRPSNNTTQCATGWTSRARRNSHRICGSA